MMTYCERCGPEFWAEPLNALSNASFLLAAALAWWSARRRRCLTREIGILIGLAACIGIGSFLFHTMPSRTTMYLDVVPILMFQLDFVWVYSQRLMNLNRMLSGALLLGLLTTSILALPVSNVLNGSLTYVPAWLLLAAFGAYHVQHAKHHPWQLMAATILLFIALVFRTIDRAVCETIPCGTHFLWHLFNGGVIFLAIDSITRNQEVSVLPIDPA